MKGTNVRPKKPHIILPINALWCILQVFLRTVRSSAFVHNIDTDQ